MKRAFLLFACAAIGATAAQLPNEGLIWSDRPTKGWTDAYPVGNGLMGAMVFGDAPVTRIQFNRTGLWTYAPRCNDVKGAYRYLNEMRRKIFAGDRKGAFGTGYNFAGGRWGQAMFQPFGDLFVGFTGVDGKSVTNLVRRLSIEQGVARSSFACKDVTYEQETFTPYFDPDLVVHTVKASRPGALACTVRLTTPHTNSTAFAKGDLLGFDGRVRLMKGFTNAVSFAARAKLVLTGAGARIEAADGALRVTGADALEIRLTGATNRKDWKTLAGDPAADCAAQLAKAEKKTVAQLFRHHAAHFRHRFAYQARLDLPGDPELAKLPTAERLNRQAESHDGAFASLVYAFGKYLLISCSRPDG